jgi:hypothetical protein
VLTSTSLSADRRPLPPPLAEACPDCSGSGADPKTGQSCGTCNGLGEIYCTLPGPAHPMPAALLGGRKATP